MKAIAEGLKAGRALSAKNETTLREARDAIDSVLSSLGDDDAAKSTGTGGDDQEKASEPEPAKSDEEPSGAKSGDEPTPRASARAFLALTSILEKEL